MCWLFWFTSVGRLLRCWHKPALFCIIRPPLFEGVPSRVLSFLFWLVCYLLVGLVCWFVGLLFGLVWFISVALRCWHLHAFFLSLECLPGICVSNFGSDFCNLEICGVFPSESRAPIRLSFLLTQTFVMCWPTGIFPQGAFGCLDFRYLGCDFLGMFLFVFPFISFAVFFTSYHIFISRGTELSWCLIKGWKMKEEWICHHLWPR